MPSALIVRLVHQTVHVLQVLQHVVVVAAEYLNLLLLFLPGSVTLLRFLLPVELCARFFEDFFVALVFKFRDTELSTRILLFEEPCETGLTGQQIVERAFKGWIFDIFVPFLSKELLKSSEREDYREHDNDKDPPRAHLLKQV